MMASGCSTRGKLRTANVCGWHGGTKASDFALFTVFFSSPKTETTLSPTLLHSVSLSCSQEAEPESLIQGACGTPRSLRNPLNESTCGQARSPKHKNDNCQPPPRTLNPKVLNPEAVTPPKSKPEPLVIDRTENRMQP